MKKTIACWSNRPQIKSITYPVFQKYADYYGYDFNYDWNPIPKYGNGWLYWAYQKFGIYNLLNKYDQVCWIDDDVLIREGAKNIFDYVSLDKFGFVLTPGDNTYASNQIKEQLLFDEWWIKDELQNNSNFDSYKEYGSKSPTINSGVMVVSKKHQFIFDYNNINPPYVQYEDQGYINGMINKHKIDYVSLGHEWNLNFGIFQNNHYRSQAYFLHLCGHGWSDIKNKIPHDQLPSTITQTHQCPENWNINSNVSDVNPDLHRARTFLWLINNNIITPFNGRK